MNLNLSLREKVLGFLVLLALIFLVYWYGLLNPLLSKTAASQMQISSLKRQLAEIEAAQKTGPSLAAKTFKLQQREEQFNLIAGFIDAKFRELNIKLTSLKQSSEGNKLAVDLSFNCSYARFLQFLSALEQSGILLVIDSADVVQGGEGVVVGMRLLSGFK